MHSRQYEHVLDEHDHRNQQTPPFLTLHIKLLKQFKDSRTFTDFTEPLLPKNELHNPACAIAMLLWVWCNVRPDHKDGLACMALLGAGIWSGRHLILLMS